MAPFLRHTNYIFENASFHNFDSYFAYISFYLTIVITSFFFSSRLKLSPKFLRMIYLLMDINLHLVLAIIEFVLTHLFSCRTEFFPKLSSGPNYIFFYTIKTLPSLTI